MTNPMLRSIQDGLRGATGGGPRVASSVAALLGCAQFACAFAQSADHPEWKLGDRWVFQRVHGLPPEESSWSRTVTKRLPDGTFRIKSDTRVLLFDGEGNSLDKRGLEYSWRRFNFPLAIGKTWKHDWKDAGEVWSAFNTSEWKVTAYESVTVPAGTFDCFRVEGTIWRSTINALAPTGKAAMSRTTELTYWYCPKVKWAAKWSTREQPHVGAPYFHDESVLTEFAVTD